MNPRLIGIGNEYRSDDAIGLIVARRLKQTADRTLDVHEASGEGAALMELWHGGDLVVVVDAAHSRAAAGAIHRFDATIGPLPPTFGANSTHTFSLPQAVELARMLGRLPRRLVVFGITGQVFDNGAALSPAVASAVDHVCAQVCREWAPHRKESAHA